MIANDWLLEAHWFEIFKDACEYARANPGLTLKRHSSGNGWVVGKRNRINPHPAGNASSPPIQTRYFRKQSSNRPTDDYHYSYHTGYESDYFADSDTQTGYDLDEYDLIERDFSSDVEDYARSNEEGWFYKD